MRGQAMAEVGVLALVLVVLALGLSSVWSVVQVEIGLSAVAEEAARAASLAPSTDLVEQRGTERGMAVASGYGLKNGSLVVTVDSSQFEAGGRVRARATYQVTSSDLPLVVAGGLDLAREQTEIVPPFRSLP
jgi:Flp pilus assembly protein TadG